MNQIDENRLRSFWKDHRVASPALTPEELAARAARFEREIRRRNVRDQVSFWLVAVIAGMGGVLIPGLWVKVGSFLLLAWCLYSLWGLRRFGAVERPAAAGPEACAAFHLLQLERQRDIVRSWPLGIGLAVPGFVLMTLGLDSNHQGAEFSIALIAVFVFMYIALVIYGRSCAARWQHEIDELRHVRER
jgi:hypothetical protein